MSIPIGPCFRALVFLFSAWAISAPAASAEPSQSLPIAASIRPDRTTFGFSAFLEIRADGHRALRVVKVSSEGPAREAGFEVGDLVVAMAGQPLPPWQDDLQRITETDLTYPPGERVMFTVERQGETMDIPVRAVVMSPETQQELLRWVTVATERKSQGQGLYCHDVRPSRSGSHYLCHDEAEAGSCGSGDGQAETHEEEHDASRDRSER